MFLPIPLAHQLTLCSGKMFMSVFCAYCKGSKSFACVCNSKQNDVIIEYMEESLETGTSLTDGAIAPAPVSVLTSAPAPVSTTVKKVFCFYSENDATHYC